MIYLNGKFMPIEEACVPVLDRGFIFGDGVYEVIPAYSRKLFRLASHLHRLQHSLDSIRLKNPYSNSQWHDLLKKIVAIEKATITDVYTFIVRKCVFRLPLSDSNYHLILQICIHRSRKICLAFF